MSNTCNQNEAICTWEKIARASNAKKFSLVYQELGSETCKVRGWILLIEDLLEAVPLPKWGELRLAVDESLSDNLRSMRLSSLSSGRLSSNDRRKSFDANVDFLEPMEQNGAATYR